MVEIRCWSSECKWCDNVNGNSISNCGPCTKTDINMSSRGCKDYAPRLRKSEEYFAHTRNGEVSLPIFTQYHLLTNNNRAENQGECPHCYEKAKDNFYYSLSKDFDSFAGIVERGKTKLDKYTDMYPHVFKCPKCNEYFWFHQSGVYIRFKE